MNNFNWEYHFGTPPAEAGAEAGMFAAIFLLAVVGLILLLGLAQYIMQAIGLMGIAKKRGFDKPWLAWIPFASTYLLGKVADDICYRNGKRKSYRKLLLAFEIVTMVFAGVLLGVMTPVIQELIAYNDIVTNGALLSIQTMPLFTIIASGFGIAYMVFFYIALYQIFKEYMPSTAIVFLLLSILISSLVSSIALLIMRNKVGATIANPPGHWENGVYYQHFSNPYGGNSYGASGQVGFDPYAHYNDPYNDPFYQVPPQNQPPYSGAAYQNPTQPPFSGNPPAGQASAGGWTQPGSGFQTTQTPPAQPNFAPSEGSVHPSGQVPLQQERPEDGGDSQLKSE